MSRMPKPLKTGAKYPAWRWGITPEDHILHLEILRNLAHEERGKKRLRAANR